MPDAPRGWRCAADLLLPASCLGCGRPGIDLCPGCAAPLRAAPRPRALGPGAVVWSTAVYDGVVRSALVAHKERGARSMTTALATALAAAVVAAVHDVGPAHGVPAVALVPVPSSATAVRQRGDDTVLALARAAARLLRAAGLDARAVAGLRPRRPVADSRTLGAAARRRNLAGAFALRPGAVRTLRGRCVVVVDDVVTSGASMREAARALRAAGWPASSSATVAATPTNR